MESTNLKSRLVMLTFLLVMMPAAAGQDLYAAEAPELNSGDSNDCECWGDISGPYGVPDSNVSMADLQALLMHLSMVGPPYIISPIPLGLECADLSSPAGYRDGIISTSDLAALLLYLASLGPPHIGPCMPGAPINPTSTAKLDIKVNGQAWDGSDVEPNDLIEVTWQDQEIGYGGFGDFRMNVSSGDSTGGWITQQGWLFPPWFDIVGKVEGGFDVEIAAAGNPSPTGNIFGVTFRVPEYEPGLEYIIIDPCSGSWNGAYGVPGPEDPLPYAELHIAGEEEEVDYGDAPDPNYQTLLVRNGARHVIVAGMYLGSGVDAEPDGQPDPNALGDDGDGNDDEDGVEFTSPLIPGQWATVDVNANSEGFLDAWIDFGGDGMWAPQRVDRIFTSEPLNIGINSLDFQVPFWSQPGPTFARFRFSSVGALPHVGQAPDGEVEDYKINIEKNASIKWIQPPDITSRGIDIRVDDLHWLADDFECNSYGRITDVHIWGSWKNDEVGEITRLHLSFHSDDPVGPPGTDPNNQYSKPDVQLWERDLLPEEFEMIPTVELPAGEYWWDPAGGELLERGDYQLWRIDVHIAPEEAFVQRGDPCNPVIYWLDVQVDTEFGEFGWKTRWWPEHYMDNAVWDFGSELPRIWQELRYPEMHPYHPNSIDLAFVLTGEELVPPKPPIPHLKWSQPPIETKPMSGTPVYCGWDEESHREIISFECWGPDWPYQCLGDADNDGCVNTSDLFELKKAWGSSYPEAKYNPCADFDRNLRVDHSDFAIMRSHWFRCAPFPDGNCPAWRGGIPTIGQVEYWDLFAVCLSPKDVYWNLVNGGGGSISDPLMYPDPAGASVIAVDPNTPLEGIAWGFGGLDWGDGILESDVNSYSIELMGQDSYYLSVVLDTSTAPQTDGYVPSWGTISNIVVRPWDEGAGVWGEPCSPNWVISPYDPDVGTSVSGGTSSSVTLAINDFGKQELEEQNGTGIWGAAVELPAADGYKVEFETDVYTWDSYDDEGPEARVAWQMVADDFRCLGTMPIIGVHWWGSYLKWEGSGPPPVQPEGWHIGFWSNVPVGVDADFSHPGRLLWQVEVPAKRVKVEYAGEDHFFENDPNAPSFPESCFQYYLKFESRTIRDDERFWQYEFVDETTDDTFWISITALYPYGSPPVRHAWGWKTRPWSWMDDAVTFSLPKEPNESTVLAPTVVKLKPLEYETESYDVSFELETDPRWVKWEQAFTGIRHWPHYEDEKSMAVADAAGGEPDIIRLVADDWPCDHNGAVSSVAWWGSYIGYTYEACQGLPVGPPAKPDYFLLSIWRDVPANVDANYSHPGEKIWEYRAHEYDEVLAGYDKHPEDTPWLRTEPVFRYMVRLPEDEWFCQEKADGIYWLSIVAVYSEPLPEPFYPWGWTNHKYNRHDGAVAGYPDAGGPAPAWRWEELHDQTGMSEDMSFILFTECLACSHPDFDKWIEVGKPRCWCYETQCHGDSDDSGDVKGSDFLALKSSWYKCYPNPNYNPCADFDHDGCVKASDFLILKKNWYKTVDPNCHEGL